MSMLRSVLKQTFCYNHPKVNPKTIMLTKVVNLELEKICLEKYYNTVKGHITRLEKFSTLEADMELLDEQIDDLKLSQNQKFALIFRSEQKKILKSNLEIVSHLRMCLEKSEELIALKEQDATQEELDRHWKSIYLSPMESEKIFMVNGDFIDKEEEELYYYRRLQLRNHLKEYFNLRTK